VTQRYKQLVDMVRFARPETIIEVGTHSGKRAFLICAEAVKHRERVHYVGYDLFDLATDEINGREFNGKRRADEAAARERLDQIVKACPGFSYHLVKGNTRDTLHGSTHCADFVFIDGGHSVETIRGDFDALKTSRVIALDDYYSGRIDTSKAGCNQILMGVPHVVLPHMDRGPPGAVQIAAVGYDPKWVAAIEQCRKTYKLDTVSFWRPDGAIFSDLIVCANTLEGEYDLKPVMENVVGATGQRIFFTLKEDALRSIAWWKQELSKYCVIDEWYGHSGEVVGTARPLLKIAAAKGLQAWADDKRLENVKINVAGQPKRFKYEMVPPHDGRVILACYGPSLKDTWEDIKLEKEQRGGVLVTVSGAHDFLLERGVVPDYHLECDPRPHKAKVIAKGHPDVKYYIASCCHPDLLARLHGCDVTLWHMASSIESMEGIKDIEPEAMFVPGGGNAGLRAWPLFYILGYRNFSIYGMDYSFADDGEQHASAHFGNKQQVLDVMTPDGRWFKTSAVLVCYKDHFFQAWDQHMSDCQIELHGDGLLQHICSLHQANQTEAA
jgi:hypothetical protein